MSDRYQTIAGSAFDVDWGTGYDLVLLPNFPHHLDLPTCALRCSRILGQSWNFRGYGSARRGCR
ncbi:hypothetical protein CUJ84_Chr000490 [Rhizobium leguminosarum]|uniref:Uncharacterized protein n=1 Tax=Rhizobium leguminosarum TaxID=384 RepID=A0A2K9YYG3_RHILE|nr:hypothetical protein CUJ84_Chr000490 [Rhizobium leguminosarum]